MTEKVPSPPTMEISLDGYTDLPPGRIANVVTFLERRDPPPAHASVTDGLAVDIVHTPDIDWFRRLYRRIGEDWLWFSHAVMPETELTALLRSPATVILAARRDGDDVGLAELSFGVPGEVEIVTFGVVPEAIGTGVAHALMSATLAAAFRPGIGRVWLHTCSFDHPRAVTFYRRNGFQPYKFAIEVSADPRATGALPETAAPHVAFFRNPHT